MNYTNIILIYFVIITLICIVITVYDKSAAQNNKQRISEKSLMSLGLIGGALPMLITMKIIRHKTKHKKFMIGLPMEILFQIIIIAVAYQYFR